VNALQQQYAIQSYSTRLGGDGGEKTGGGQVTGGGAFVRARRFQNVDPMPVYGKCKKAVEDDWYQMNRYITNQANRASWCCHYIST
jgi:hypothetical protein